MPREPFCFIHASGLHLDGPLEDIGALPDDLRNTVEDATLSAFENLIRECLEREAAFLLLAGESFEERRRSLRARVALVNGLRRLDEHGVRVFVMPGEADPAIAWHAIDGLPKNVTLLTPHSEGPILIERDRRAIAWLAAGPANESASGDRSGGPVRIGVCSPRH
ncbi:MAG: metallophosphoesterase family protein, partial [Planctomycetaceae bacterium]